MFKVTLKDENNNRLINSFKTKKEAIAHRKKLRKAGRKEGIKIRWEE